MFFIIHRPSFMRAFGQLNGTRVECDCIVLVYSKQNNLNWFPILLEKNVFQICL